MCSFGVGVKFSAQGTFFTFFPILIQFSVIVFPLLSYFRTSTLLQSAHLKMLYTLTIALLLALCDSKSSLKRFNQRVKSVNQHHPQLKIVNGQPTKNSEYPWIVSLRIIGYVSVYR